MKSFITYLLLAIIGVLFLLKSNTAQAQTPLTGTSSAIIKSNAACTKVGNPPDDQKPVACKSSSIGGGALGDVLNWATEITSRLQVGTWGFLNRILEAVTNGSYSTSTCPPDCIQGVYWCTYLIIDTYNLAGHTGLTRGAHAAVVNMRRWWYTEGVNQGYIYIDYPTNNQLLTEVKPGYAMFMEQTAGVHTDSEHVDMVKSITVDQRGDGIITTYDSNSSKPSHEFGIAGWQIVNTPYPVRGFGGI